MMVFRRITKLLAAPMAAVMFMVSVPFGAADAGLIPTERVIERAAVDADRARIIEFLARDDVRARLVELGVDPAMAVARVAGLSPAEVRDIAGRLDRLPAGQGIVESLIGATLIVFLVLLVTDLLGLTDVFPFVRR